MEEILCIHKPRKYPQCGGKVARIFVTYLLTALSSLSASATIYVGHVTHEEGYGKEYHECAYDVPGTVPTKTVYLYGKVRIIKQREEADLVIYYDDPRQHYNYNGSTYYPFMTF